MNDLSLYQIEADFVTLLDTEEAGVPEELRAEFAQQLGEYTEKALGKRDDCAKFVRWVEGQIVFAQEEEKRLYERRKRLENGLERFKRYIVGVVQQFASNMNKGPRRLEGRTSTLTVVKNPDSVDVFDAQQLPVEYTHVELRVPGSVIAKLPEEVQKALKLQAVQYGIVPVKANIAQALKAGVSVPGARLDTRKVRLEIR